MASVSGTMATRIEPTGMTVSVDTTKMTNVIAHKSDEFLTSLCRRPSGMTEVRFRGILIGVNQHWAV